VVIFEANIFLVRELEDRSWFPAFLRNHQTEFLAFIAKVFHLYEPIKPLILAKLNERGAMNWTDTCSGSGGPIIALNIPHKTLLTDLYPPEMARDLSIFIDYHPNPIDISKTLPPGKGLITMFNSFHHFDDDTKEKILNNTIEAGRPFLFTELLQPDIKSFLLVCFSTTLGHWLMVPFMKPFNWKRIFFTYIIPIHTITIFIDGIISVCKARTEVYYKIILYKNTKKDYRVQFHKTKGRFSMLYTLEGTPLK
jgi:hypothetical protein